MFSSWERQRTLIFLFGDFRSFYFHSLLKLTFLVSNGQMCLHDKQNNTWLLLDMEFLFLCSTWHLTRELSSLSEYIKYGKKSKSYVFSGFGNGISRELRTKIDTSILWTMSLFKKKYIHIWSFIYDKSPSVHKPTRLLRSSHKRQHFVTIGSWKTTKCYAILSSPSRSFWR